jgi:hypothetical protein
MRDGHDGGNLFRGKDLCDFEANQANKTNVPGSVDLQQWRHRIGGRASFQMV